MAESDVRVPAGWYPDPLGLPQLRWWDNTAWTEHTSEARQPMVAQETVVTQSRLTWADDEPPADLTETDGASGVPAAHAPAAETLLQLEAPSVKTLVPADQAPQEKFAEFVPTHDADPIAGRFDDLLVDRAWGAPSTADETPAPAAATATTADASGAFDYAAHLADIGIASQPAPAETTATPAFTEHVTAAQVAAAQAQAAQFAAQAAAAQLSAGHGTTPRGMSELSTAERTIASSRRTGTSQAWIIAASPLTFIVVSLFLLSSGGLDVSGALVVALSLALPYIGSIPLAIADRMILRRRGLRPAHWLWVMGSPVVYLIVRAIVLTRRTGRGFGPVLGVLASVMSTFAAILLVPGIVIGVNPIAFSHAIEGSVEQQAAAFDVKVHVTCPPNPPTVVGQDFTCMAYTEGDEVNGFDVRVSLQRANGWIAWQVDDWGKLNADLKQR